MPPLEAATHVTRLLWSRPTAATFVMAMNRIDVVDHIVVGRVVLDLLMLTLLTLTLALALLTTLTLTLT